MIKMYNIYNILFVIAVTMIKELQPDGMVKARNRSVE